MGHFLEKGPNNRCRACFCDVAVENHDFAQHRREGLGKMIFPLRYKIEFSMCFPRIGQICAQSPLVPLVDSQGEDAASYCTCETPREGGISGKKCVFEQFCAQGPLDQRALGTKCLGRPFSEKPLKRTFCKSFFVFCPGLRFSTFLKIVFKVCAHFVREPL